MDIFNEEYALTGVFFWGGGRPKTKEGSLRLTPSPFGVEIFLY